MNQAFLTSFHKTYMRYELYFIKILQSYHFSLIFLFTALDLAIIDMMKCYVHSEYAQNPIAKNELALISIQQNQQFCEKFGHRALQIQFGWNGYKQNQVLLSGYCAFHQRICFLKNQVKIQWAQQEKSKFLIDNLNENQAQLIYKINSKAGMSGSPIMYLKNQKYRLIGIHIGTKNEKKKKENQQFNKVGRFLDKGAQKFLKKLEFEDRIAEYPIINQQIFLSSKQKKQMTNELIKQSELEDKDNQKKQQPNNNYQFQETLSRQQKYLLKKRLELQYWQYMLIQKQQRNSDIYQKFNQILMHLELQQTRNNSSNNSNNSNNTSNQRNQNNQQQH